MTISFDNPQKLSFNLKLTGPAIAKHIFAYRPRFTQLRMNSVAVVFQRTRALRNVFGGMHITRQVQSVAQFVTYTVNVAPSYFKDAAGLYRGFVTQPNR